MAPGLNQCIVYVGGTDQSILNRMATDNSAKAISCSWSWKPADPQVDDPIFMQMAAQGQTYAVPQETAPAGAQVSITGRRKARTFSASAATHLVTTGAGGPWSSETGWADSGGGISIDRIQIPSWQHNKKVVTAANGASKKLRNGPDVAMEGDFQNYICYNGTCAGGWGGTSFACPEWIGYPCPGEPAGGLSWQSYPGLGRSGALHDWHRPRLHHQLPRHSHWQ